MDGMNCVARRTRRRWDNFYEKCYHEKKRNTLESDGVSGSDKRDRNQSETIVVGEDKPDFVASSEWGCDDAGEVEKVEKDGNVVSRDCGFRDEKKLDGRVDIDGDGVLKSDGVEVLEKNQFEDDGVDAEILSSDDHGDDGFGILKNDRDDDGGGGGILEIDEDEFNGVGILKKDKRVDDGDESYKDEDKGIEMLKSGVEDNDDGVDSLKSDGDEDNDIEMLKSQGEEHDDDDDSVESLKSDEEEDNGIEMLKSGVEDDDGGVDSLKNDGDEDNGIEMLKSGGEDDDDDDSVESLKSDEEEDDGTEMLKSGEVEDYGGVDRLTSDGDEDNGFEMLMSGGEDDGDGVESLKEDEEEGNGIEMLKSGGEKDVDGENTEVCSREKAQIDSEKEDSESEPTSKEEELYDVDYEEDESSTSESSGMCNSDNELVNGDDQCGADENDNLMEGAEDKLPDTIEDRKERDIKQEKDNKSDEDDKQIFNDKEKSTKTRKSGGELERDDKIDEEKKKRKLSSVEHSAGMKLKKVPNESASTLEDQQESWNDDVKYFFTRMDKTKVEKGMFSSKKFHSARDLDLIKILVASLNSVEQKQYNIDEKALAENSLPLKFKFEEEVVPPPEKSEWEKHVDSLFCHLDMGLREVETDCTENFKMENEGPKTTEKIDESPAASCRRGNHQPILDEQIGIVCEFCGDVIMEIKHILPPFYTSTRDRRDRKAYYYDESPSSFFDDIQCQGSASSGTDSTSYSYGTVWDLIPGVKKDLYPHQREGFEFMWKNIAGGIIIEKLKQTLAEDARGCIISHAPGTGKTRLTIVFLQSFLKMYPTCSPMIIAPRVMLQTWEAEFKKWNFNITFHNLSEKELSGKENAVATELLGQVGSGAFSIDCTRLLKLYSWARGGSILGISYQLFKKLAGENGETQQHEKIREVLLVRPGLLVLDEGHTPRNDKSQIWKVLKKVSTQRRIILSGTPFQNSLQELSNTLCVANPKFANQVSHRKYGRLTRSSDTNRDEAMKLKAILAPYVHVHKGTILKESLPGLRHTLVFLHPTEWQKVLLKSAWKEENFLRRNWMISLVSVHPSIDGVMEGYPGHRSKLEEIKSDIDAGVKTRFLMKLIHFSDALGERVLVFSQFIDSLLFIKKQLVSNFSWNAGREVLYMDGQLDDRRRQVSISSFNDGASEAKVLLASVKACSEGINLIGASRVVLLDTLWNPSVEKQAICRAYRIGQKKVVHVYRLFTSGVEVRLGQFPCQIHKEQVSRLLFALGEEQGYQSGSDDQVMEAMLSLDNFKHIFDKVLSQPNESDLIETFGLRDN